MANTNDRFQVMDDLLRPNLVNAMTEIAVGEAETGNVTVSNDILGAMREIFEIFCNGLEWGAADSGHSPYALSDLLQVRLESFGLTEKFVADNLNNEKALNAGLEMETKGLDPERLMSIMLLDSLSQNVVDAMYRESVTKFGFIGFDNDPVKFAYQTI